MFELRYQTIALNSLKYHRLRGYSQEALADKAVISMAKLSDMECGRRNVEVWS